MFLVDVEMVLIQKSNFIQLLKRLAFIIGTGKFRPVAGNG